MLSRIFIGGLTCLALFSTPCLAADSGFYIGAGAGQAKTKVDDVLDSGIRFDESDFSFKVFGGYRFFPWLAVEAAYLDGGSPEIRATSSEFSARLGIDVQGLVAAAVFSLPLGERFELFIKPGIAYWDSKTSFQYIDNIDPDFSFGYSQGDSGSAFFIGGGAGFNFSEHLGLLVEYEWFEVAPTYDSYEGGFVYELDASTGVVSGSLVYRF